MSMLSFFLGQKKKSAAVAKERLRLIIAHERTDPARSDYLPALQRELLAVISKYVNVTNEEIKVHLERQENIEVLEVKIEIPQSYTQTTYACLRRRVPCAGHRRAARLARAA